MQNAAHRAQLPELARELLKRHSDACQDRLRYLAERQLHTEGTREPLAITMDAYGGTVSSIEWLQTSTASPDPCGAINH